MNAETNFFRMRMHLKAICRRFLSFGWRNHDRKRGYFYIHSKPFKFTEWWNNFNCISWLEILSWLRPAIISDHYFATSIHNVMSVSHSNVASSFVSKDIFLTFKTIQQTKRSGPPQIQFFSRKFNTQTQLDLENQSQNLSVITIINTNTHNLQ